MPLRPLQPELGESIFLISSHTRPAPAHRHVLGPPAAAGPRFPACPRARLLPSFPRDDTTFCKPPQQPPPPPRLLPHSSSRQPPLPLALISWCHRTFQQPSTLRAARRSPGCALASARANAHPSPFSRVAPPGPAGRRRGLAPSSARRRARPFDFSHAPPWSRGGARPRTHA